MIRNFDQTLIIIFNTRFYLFHNRDIKSRNSIFNTLLTMILTSNIENIPNIIRNTVLIHTIIVTESL